MGYTVNGPYVYRSRWNGSEQIHHWEHNNKQLTEEELKLMEYTKDQSRKVNDLKSLIESTLDIIISIVWVSRALIYAGAIASSLFYFKNTPLAIAVAVTISFAHLTMWASEELRVKREKLRNI